jgi:Ca2+-binding RTX toxin-like protein
MSGNRLGPIAVFDLADSSRNGRLLIVREPERRCTMTGDFWRHALRRLLRMNSRDSKRRGLRGRDWQRTHLSAEPLERREMLAVTYLAPESQVYIVGSAGTDQVQIWTEGGNLRVRMESALGIDDKSFALATVSSIQFLGSDGDDQFVNSTSVPALAFGGNGDDVLTGGAGADRLFGGMGMDTLAGGAGNDELRGEDDNDSLAGDGGDDVLIGSTGNDLISGGADVDTLYGDGGDDELRGNDGNDVLMGGGGRDLLIGHAGDDRLFGGLDDDTLYGCAGNDTLRGEDGNDTIHGGDGVDQLLGSTGNDRMFGGANNDTLHGDDGDDELHGDDGNDSLFGGNGADLMLGGLSDDRLFGGANNDTIYGEEGVDELRGEDGDDTLHGGVGVDLVIGSTGNDRLFGGTGIDTLYGDEGNDELHGEEDDDTLFGGIGNDLMLGDGGNDKLFGGDDNDILHGQEGDDELRAEVGDDFLSGGNGIDLLIGSVGADRLFGDADNDELLGDEGDDLLHGSEGDDNLFGSDGRDQMYGGMGNDRLWGGTDDDTLFGDEGDDELRGEEDDDSLFGGMENDLVHGGSGHDLMLGDSGDDQLLGNTGNDVLIGGHGSDELQGEWGDDIVIGGATTHDSHHSRLIALSQAWSSIGTYTTRIATIENETFAAPLIANETLIDDKVADSVFGGDDQDWFFQTGYMSVYVPEDVHYHEEETPIDAWKQAFGSASPAADGNGDGTVDAADYIWLRKLGNTAPAGGSGSHADHHHNESVINYLPELEGFDLISATDMFSDRASTEAIRSTMPHPDAPALQREHLSLFETVRYDQVTHYALHDGAWSDPTTWKDGIVPPDGARVLIPKEVEVRVDGVMTARLATIRVDGTLSFETNVNTELRVDTVAVSGSGTFEMGTEAAPIMPHVTARLLITNDGPIDRTVDPYGISRGLLTHGVVSMYGAEVTSFVAIGSPALVGSTILNLKTVPTGWKVGDTIVVAATTAGTTQNETRHIVAIVGSVVVLDQALSYSHITARADLDIHIANVTRNAVIESESDVVNRRGHVMFMHNDSVDIAFAGFYKLGRTDKTVPVNDPVVNSDWTLQPGTGTNPRARYSVHFHRTGTMVDGDPATVRGSAVIDSPGWGFVNHSSYVDMFDNVAFDVHGAAFTTEVGDETGSFRNNLAIGTSASGQAEEDRKSIQDFGHGGEGFWFQGAGIHVTGNIAAGNAGAGFTFFNRSLTEGGVKKEFVSANLPDPSIAEGQPTIDIGKIAVFTFSNNVAYASGSGLETWYMMENSTTGEMALLENSIFWNNTIGVELGYTQHTILRNLTVIHAPIAPPQPMNGLRHNAVTTDIVYDNLSVSGYRIGIMVPTRGSSVVNGGTFNNDTDIYIRTSGGRNALITGFSYVPKISMVMSPSLTDSAVATYFGQDVVTLNFGPFVNKRLYYTQQGALAVPFPSPISGLPAGYVGLTNQQLWTQHGVALGGSVAPLGSITVPQIVGLIAP